MKRIKGLYENHKNFLWASVISALIYSYSTTLGNYIWILPLMLVILAIWWLIPQWWLRPLVAGAITIIPGMVELLLLPDSVGMGALIGFFVLVPISALLGILITYAPSNKSRWYHGIIGLFLYSITASITIRILIFIL